MPTPRMLWATPWPPCATTCRWTDACGACSAAAGTATPASAPMAAAAERHADRLVVPDDNPRGEDPAAIRAAVLAGLSAAARHQALEIAGRGEAIARVLVDADAEDVVLIAGKGHETYQEIAGVRYPFSDLAEAERALAARARAGGEATP